MHEKARITLIKPKEDVVIYLVCKNSQFAVENYLKGNLIIRKFETHNKETMNSLLDRCKSLNNKYNQIDLNTIECRAHSIDFKFCQDVNKVSSCFETADSLGTFSRKLNILKASLF